MHVLQQTFEVCVGSPIADRQEKNVLVFLRYKSEEDSFTFLIFFALVLV